MSTETSTVAYLAHHAKNRPHAVAVVDQDTKFRLNVFMVTRSTQQGH
jgi:hypothetical protein